MQGPQPVKATFESWDASWGDFHYGTGIGSYVCHAGSGFHCGGKNAFSFFVLPAGSAVILATIPTVTNPKRLPFSCFILHSSFSFWGGGSVHLNSLPINSSSLPCNANRHSRPHSQRAAPHSQCMLTSVLCKSLPIVLR